MLVALDSGQSVIYAPASGWDQLYLRWTFRNFRSLPQKVLNPRQQKLIAALCREGRTQTARDLTLTPVVGTIESFSPALLSPMDVSAADRQPHSCAYGTWNRAALKVAAGAMVAVITILTWYQLKAQSVSAPGLQTVAVSPRISAPTAVAKDLLLKDVSPTSVEPMSKSVALPPSPVPIAVSGAIATPPVPPAAILPVSSKPPANTPELNNPQPNNLASNAHYALVAHATVFQAAADQPRMRISGRPQKLVYPVCPETQIRGQVSLQAVVSDDGAVSRVRVLNGDRVLAAAAVEAVRQWRYEPSSSADQSLERETNITVSFISNEVVAVSFPNSAPLTR